MKQYKVYLLAIASCILLTGCPSDDDDINDIITDQPSGENTQDKNELEELNNVLSSKPAYAPKK